MKTEATETQHRITRAFGAMPFGGGAIVHTSPADVTLETTADNLEQLRERLESVAEGQRARDTQLNRYRIALSGLRELVAIVQGEPRE